MTLLRQLLEQYVRVEKDPDNLTVSDGEAGRGIYFSLSRYPGMVNYYKRGMENGFRIIKATPKPNTIIIDLTRTDIEEELIKFMRMEIEGLRQRMQGYIPPKINRSNYQRFGRLIQDFIHQKFPKADAYVVNHQADGTDLPRGKQLVIINEPSFIYTEI